ncbi:MAG: hypothetical protein IAE90_15760 [Ignavibacteria bacterium]|nr:hypothetical protein [Ignavibacteria bacterium]
MNVKNFKYNPFLLKDFFIFEVGAIPKTKRLQFLKKLLNRRGSGDQKNVIFLKKLNEIIDKKTSINDTDTLFAKLLGVSARMLDCHRSRLLKQLRQFYFGLELRSDCSAECARKLWSLGMIKEAKILFEKLQQRLENRKRTPLESLQLLEYYSRLADYYIFNKDQRKLNLYLRKYKSVLNKIRAKQTGRHEMMNIQAEYFRLLGEKLIFNRFRKNNFYGAIGNFEKALKLSRSAANAVLSSRLSVRLALLHNIVKDRQDSLKMLRDAYSYAAANSAMQEAKVIHSHIMVSEFILDNSTADTALDVLSKLYKEITTEYSDVSQILEIQYNCLRLMIYLNHPDADSMSEEYINRRILYSRKAGAITSWYLEVSDLVSESVYTIKINEDFPVVAIDQKMLNVFEEINNESLVRFRHVYEPNVTAIVYMNRIEQEFWKNTHADFELADLYTKKLKRIIRLHNLNISHSWVESASLGLKIFEELIFEKAEKVFKKNERVINVLLEKLRSKELGFNIAADFAKLVYIYQFLKVKEFRRLLEHQYKWIKANKIEILPAA